MCVLKYSKCYKCSIMYEKCACQLRADVNYDNAIEARKIDKNSCFVNRKFRYMRSELEGVY